MIFGRFFWTSLIDVLLSSIKEIHRLNKGVSNIYLEFTSPIFGELQLTQLLLSFETSCCNLKNQSSW